MIRLVDIVISIFAITFLFPFFVCAFILSLIDTKSPIFLQSRIGLHGEVFTLYKYRTMNISTPGNIPTHEISSHESVSKIGSFLRTYKIDELLQFFNVIKGDMSIVGYRPCLPTQTHLIQERKKFELDKILPGITGPAQLLGIDMKDPKLLALIDSSLKDLDISSYFKIIVQTIFTKSSYEDRTR